MARVIKGDAWDQDHVNAGIVGKGLAHGLHNTKGSFLKVVRTRIATEFHVGGIQDLWQKNSLAFGYEIIDKVVSTNLVRQGIVSHYGLCLLHTFSQASNNGQRQLF